MFRPQGFEHHQGQVLLQQDAWWRLGTSLWAVPARDRGCVTYTHTHTHTHTHTQNSNYDMHLHKKDIRKIMKLTFFFWCVSSCVWHSVSLRSRSSTWTRQRSWRWVLQHWSNPLNLRQIVEVLQCKCLKMCIFSLAHCTHDACLKCNVAKVTFIHCIREWDKIKKFCGGVISTIMINI